jgi:hypothetical protein
LAAAAPEYIRFARRIPDLRRVLEREFAQGLAQRRTALSTSAWYQSEAKVLKYLAAVKAGQLDCASYPLLTKLFHIRPLQWYGCRFRSLARGRRTPTVLSHAFDATSHLTPDFIAQFGTQTLLETPAYFWLCFSFEILDAHGRRFPFYVESSARDSNYCNAAGYIYPLRHADSSPAICVGRIQSGFSREHREGYVHLDLAALRASVPELLEYSRHDAFRTFLARWVLQHNPFSKSVENTQSIFAQSLRVRFQT